MCNIIIIGFNQPTSVGIKNLNIYLKERHGEMKEISSHAGGYKALETYIYSIACNYISLDDFLEAFERQVENLTSDTVLLVQDQHSEIFEVHHASSYIPTKKNKYIIHERPASGARIVPGSRHTVQNRKPEPEDKK